MGKDEEAQLKGLSKIFNSVTVNGRANVAKATYASVAALIAYFVFRPNAPKKPTIPAAGPAAPIPPNKPCNCPPLYK